MHALSQTWSWCSHIWSNGSGHVGVVVEVRVLVNTSEVVGIRVVTDGDAITVVIHVTDSLSEVGNIWVVEVTVGTNWVVTVDGWSGFVMVGNWSLVLVTGEDCISGVKVLARPLVKIRSIFSFICLNSLSSNSFWNINKY